MVMEKQSLRTTRSLASLSISLSWDSRILAEIVTTCSPVVFTRLHGMNSRQVNLSGPMCSPKLDTENSHSRKQENPRALRENLFPQSQNRTRAPSHRFQPAVSYSSKNKPKTSPSPGFKPEILDLNVPRSDCPPSLYQSTRVTKMFQADSAPRTSELAQNKPGQKPSSTKRGV